MGCFYAYYLFTALKSMYLFILLFCIPQLPHNQQSRYVAYHYIKKGRVEESARPGRAESIIKAQTDPDPDPDPAQPDTVPKHIVERQPEKKSVARADVGCTYVMCIE